MTYINAFHKEAAERKIRKIAASKQFTMNSQDAASYMKKNLEQAKKNVISKQEAETRAAEKWVKEHDTYTFRRNEAFNF